MPEPAAELLDPKIDLVFKLLFGREGTRDILISLLTAILRPVEPISEVEILNTSSLYESVGDKGSILDLRVRDRTGRRFAVEMQCRSHRDFPDRILFYGARLLAEQLGRGQSYGDLEPVFVIVFTNYSLFNELNRYHEVFELRDAKGEIRFSDRLRIDLIQLPKFTCKVDEVVSLEEQWVAFLKEGHRMASETVNTWAPEVARAREELERLSADSVTREKYQDRIRALLGYVTDVEGARSDALEQGRKEGRQEGQQEGRQETTVEIARCLLGRGYPIAEVAEVTGLSTEQLREIEDHL